MAVAHAAAQLEAGLLEALGRAERLQAGGGIGQDLRREVGVKVRGEKGPINPAFLQLAEHLLRLGERVGSFRIILLRQQQGADLIGDGARSP